MLKNNISRDNHIVQEALISNWTSNGYLKLYRVVVSTRYHLKKIWESKSPKSAACIKNIYTQYQDGNDSDIFEKYIEKNIEGRALPVIYKMINGKTVNTKDIKHVIKYVIAQKFRTLKGYFNYTSILREVLPGALSTFIQEVHERCSIDKNCVIPGEHHIVPVKNFPFKVDLQVSDPCRQSMRQGIFINPHVNCGRAMWLYGIKRMLEEESLLIERLAQRRWIIVNLPIGYTITTSDNPVIVMVGNSIIDGIGIPMECDIIMPINPYSFLYSGSRYYNHFTITWEDALKIRRASILNAYFNVYSKDESTDVPKIKPKIVNPIAHKWQSFKFKNKGEEKDWHEMNRSIELEFDL